MQLKREIWYCAVYMNHISLCANLYDVQIAVPFSVDKMPRQIAEIVWNIRNRFEIHIPRNSMQSQWIKARNCILTVSIRLEVRIEHMIE